MQNILLASLSSFLKKWGHPKKIILAAILLAATLAYQNCSRGFSALSSNGNSKVDIASSNQTPSATPAPGQTPTPTPGPNPIKPSIYIGYYSLMTLDQQNFVIEGWKNLVHELRGRGNVLPIFYSTQQDLAAIESMGIPLPSNLNADGLFIEKVKIAQANQFQVILQIPSIFFEFKNGKFDVSHIRTDFMSHWLHFRNLLIANNLQSSIAALYVFDEPYWNAKLQNVPIASIKTSLESINTMIKADFPDLNLALVEAYTMIDSSYNPPAGYDFIGMDCYGSFDACGDQKISIPAYYAILKSKLVPKQKLVLVPDGFVFQAERNTDPNYQARLKRTAQQFLDYAQDPANAPLIGAIFPFVFNASDDLEVNVEKIVAGNRMNEITRVYENYFFLQNNKMSRANLDSSFEVHLEYLGMDQKFHFSSTVDHPNDVLPFAPQGTFFELSFARPIIIGSFQCDAIDPAGKTTGNCQTFFFEKTRINRAEFKPGIWTFKLIYNGKTEVRRINFAG